MRLPDLSALRRTTPRTTSRPGISRASARAAEGHIPLTYRPAIDGLRAIAVVAVIIGHANEKWLPGGWLGVDIFFVISGFLITSLLLRERTSTGAIDLIGFWLARARRLLPALFLVLAAVIVAARFIGLPARRAAVSHDTLSTLFYVANWRMYASDEAYFATLATPSPLRHAWSLSVEEQFYIVYPLLLLGLLLLVRKRARLALALGGLALASAALMALLYTPGHEPSRVYYGTDTRAFELLVGAVAGVLALRSGTWRAPSAITARTDLVARRLAPVALVLVVAALLARSTAPDVLFRGGMLVLCTLTAVVVVAAASWETNPVQGVLSWEPLRRVGLISYGLYLWHWPIIVYSNQLLVEVDPLIRVYIQVVSSFVIATLSYLLIERPIRRHGLKVLIPRMPRLSFVVGSALALVVVGGAVALPSGAQRDIASSDITSNITYTAPPYISGDTTRRALLIGNSIPASYAKFYPKGTYPDLTVGSYTNPGCDLFPEARYRGDAPDPINPDCEGWRDSLTQSIADDDPDVVVVFVSQSLVADRQVEGRRLEFASDAYEDYLREGFDDLRDQIDEAPGDHRIVLLNLACHRVPDFGVDEEVTRFNDDRAVERVNTLATEWAQDNGIDMIDQNSFLCGDGYHDGINGAPLYEDYLHVTKDSGPQVWSWLAPRVRDAANGTPQQP